jgi:hypothetical protein
MGQLPVVTLDTLSNSLLVVSEEISWLAKNLLTPQDKNYVWAATTSNIFGVNDIRPRVGRFEIPWNPNSVFSIPDLEQTFDKTLPQVFDARAVEIYNQAQSQNKRIVIQWSGGIDSTAMVCAFVKNFSAADLQRIIICTTTDGIIENPYFYETQIRKRFELLHLRDLDFSDQFLDQHILLHGDPGDCIFGPSVGKYRMLWQDQQYLRSWKDSKAILYHLYHDNTNLDFAPWFVDAVSNNLAELQEQGLYTRIKTISEWHWWVYYNLKWQGSIMRTPAWFKQNLKATVSQKNLQDFCDSCFYAGTDFQVWSYQNLSSLFDNIQHNHKIQAKNYIFELDANVHYQQTKRKEISLVPRWDTSLVVDQQGVHYNSNEPGAIELVKELLLQ